MKIKKENVVKNKNEAINRINEYMDKCLLLDEKYIKKVNLLSYWFKDYINYIDQEDSFNSGKLKEYSRGDIIKANLGFNIGNEEGGLHYCVVLDKKNAKSYSTLTVVPLSSQKSTSKPNKTSVFLGNDIYQSLMNKSTNLLNEVNDRLNQLKSELNDILKLPENTEDEAIIKNFKSEEIINKINANGEKIELIEKINSELEQMKSGTIALTNQITTISKQRIYNPKKDIDILSGISLSEEKMNLIDEKIKKLYIN